MTNKIKNNLNTLIELSEKIDMSLFYSVSVTEYGVRLQGDFSDIAYAEASKLTAVEPLTRGKGFIVFEVPGLDITLTPIIEKA